MSTPEETEALVEDEAALRRRRRKDAARAHNWKLAGGAGVEVAAVREFVVGERTVVVRGRVAVELPGELDAPGIVDEATRLVAELVDPAVGKTQHALVRSAAKLLGAPDDVRTKHVFERASFFSALEEAQRGVVRAYQELENRRIDDRVEAELGLRFYLASFERPMPEITYFAGPTNSGKTHAALEALKYSMTGVYLAPLRLLALEVQERLLAAGLPTSLVTGEERVIVDEARHVSATVEMVDLGREVETAVIDEAQLLQDEQRGWAWTLAMAGVRAQKIILCGSLDGLAAARTLAERLGTTIEVRMFERKSPLRVVDAVPMNALKPGDAVVAFSRGAVVDLQGQIRRGGRTTAAIYGSLSPVVRRNEAERFRSGAAEVLVATDAIGLGLNLPIRRLIFAEVEKYDGVATRVLTPPEIRQIAGRAGRYGLHEDGQVSAFDARDVKLLRASLERFDPPRETLPIWISPTDEHLERLATILGTTRVSRLLQFFQQRLRRDEADLRIADLSETIEVSVALEFSDAYLAMPLRLRCAYARAPVSTRGKGLDILARWADRHARDGVVVPIELYAGSTARDRLLLNEDRSRLATLYLWLAQRFPQIYVEADPVRALRERIDEEIHEALLRGGDRTFGPRVAAPGGGPTAPVRRRGPRFDKRKLPKTRG